MPETLPAWHRGEWVRETCSAVGGKGEKGKVVTRDQRESGRVTWERATQTPNGKVKRLTGDRDSGDKFISQHPWITLWRQFKRKEWRNDVQNSFHLLPHSVAGVNTLLRRWQVHVAAHFLACNPAFIAPSCNTRSIRSVHWWWRFSNWNSGFERVRKSVRF